VWPCRSRTRHAAGRHLSVCQLGFQAPSHPPSALVQCTASVVCRRRRLKRRAQRAPTLSHQPCDDEDDAGSVRGSPFLFLWVGVLHALRVVHHCTAPILANNKTLRGAVRNRPSCGGLRLDRGFVDRCARASRGLLSVYTPAHRVVAGVTYGPPYSIIHVSCMQIVLVLHL
jgi:hypothetical protein